MGDFWQNHWPRGAKVLHSQCTILVHQVSLYHVKIWQGQTNDATANNLYTFSWSGCSLHCCEKRASIGRKKNTTYLVHVKPWKKIIVQTCSIQYHASIYALCLLVCSGEPCFQILLHSPLIHTERPITWPSGKRMLCWPDIFGCLGSSQSQLNALLRDKSLSSKLLLLFNSGEWAIRHLFLCMTLLSHRRRH